MIDYTLEQMIIIGNYILKKEKIDMFWVLYTLAKRNH